MLRLSGAFSPFPLSFIQGPHGLSLSPLFFPPLSPCTVNLPDISGGHDIQSLRHWYHNTSGGGGGGGPSYSLSSFLPFVNPPERYGWREERGEVGKTFAYLRGSDGRPREVRKGRRELCIECSFLRYLFSSPSLPPQISPSWSFSHDCPTTLYCTLFQWCV